MMPCSRCGGFVRLVQLVCEEECLDVFSCLNCGNVEDEQILAHRCERPEPRPEIQTPTYDPTFGRLVWADGPGGSIRLERLSDQSSSP